MTVTVMTILMTVTDVKLALRLIQRPLE